ncbi:MAG: glycosyltransferase, partial [Gemmatimonadota bacterium]|nr:glycosyltransferase [Gemmatimonadota bacterium]
DPRVSEVLAIITDDFHAGLLPAGVTPIRVRPCDWVTHLAREVPRAAESCNADIIFAPNALAPRDPRAVLYFQDLRHFRVAPGAIPSAPEIAWRAARSAWRRYAAQPALLAVAVSADISSEVIARVPLPLATIPNGVDVKGHRWEGTDDRVYVMGGIGTRKNSVTAVYAWAEVLRRGAGGDTMLEIGGCEPAWRRDELRSLASALGIANRVRVKGTMPRDEYLANSALSRVSVSCSTLEAFGLPVAEALLMGAPVLCSDIPAHIELVRRASAGTLFPVHSPAALAEALVESLEGRLPNRATPTPSDWSWSARASGHLDTYAALLGSGSHAAAPLAAA